MSGLTASSFLFFEVLQDRRSFKAQYGIVKVNSVHDVVLVVGAYEDEYKYHRHIYIEYAED